MLYSSLTAGVHTSMGAALITDGTTGYENIVNFEYKHTHKYIIYTYIYIRSTCICKYA